jgi:hypothetical protein
MKKLDYIPNFSERDELRMHGWKFVSGMASKDGRSYREAAPMGGYYQKNNPVAFCYQMEKGSAASHMALWLFHQCGLPMLGALPSPSPSNSPHQPHQSLDWWGFFSPVKNVNPMTPVLVALCPASRLDAHHPYQRTSQPQTRRLPP